MERTEERKIRYDAFISYRHTEPDMFVAKQLHRELENFTLPRNIRKLKKQGERTKISRVFRDRDELPLTVNLSDQITEALAVSDFLIVICSPRLPESMWCRKEIQTFIELHGRERVFAVLVEGEPEDSFPEELLFREEKVIQSDGSVSVVKTPVEPLAADAKGSTNKERKKKIKEEVVRLAAPMFDCTYDELKQRHRERKMKRIAGVAAVVAAVCFTFGAVSSAMALRIHGQNQEITSQNQQIAAQRDELERQYEEARLTSASLSAQKAFQLLEEGDRREAILLSAEVLTHNPDVPQVEYALTQSLGVYRDGSSALSEFMLKHDTSVQFIKLSPDGRVLLTVDGARVIYLWEVESGGLISRIEDYTNAFYIPEDSIIFLDAERFACLQRGEITVYNVTGERQTSFTPQFTGDRYGSEALLGDGKTDCFLWVCSGEAQVFNSDDYSLLFSIDSGGQKEFVNQVAFHDGQGVIVLAWKEEDRPGEAIVIDKEKGEIRKKLSLYYENVGGLYIKGEVLYAASYSDFVIGDGSTASVFGEVKGRLTAMELAGESGEKWHYDSDDSMIADVALGQGGGNGLLLVAAGNYVTALHTQDGSLAGQGGLGEDVVKLGVLMGTNRFTIYTRGGRMLWTDGGEEQFYNTVEIIGQYVCPADNIKTVLIGKEGKILVQPYLSNAVIVMKSLEGTGYETFLEDVSPGLTDVDNFENNLLVASSDKMTVSYISKEGETIWHRQLGGPVTQMGFFSEACMYVFIEEEDQVTILDRYTGDEITSYTLGDGYRNVVFEDSSILVKAYNEIRIYDTLTGELKRTVDLTDIYNISDLWEIGYGYLAVASVEDRVLRLYRESGELLDEFPINTAFASEIFLLPGENYGIEDMPDSLDIYVDYKDNTLEYYSWEEGKGFTLIRTYEDLEGQIQEIQKNLMIGSGFAYLLKEGEPVALIPNYIDRLGADIYTGNPYGEVIYTVPYYTQDMLLEEAEQYKIS